MKLAVILHLYYQNQLPEITHHLQNLTKAHIDYDLYITTPHQDTTAISTTLNHYSPTILYTINNGYDIGPFITALHKINLNQYDYVLKLHTKGKTSPNYTLINNRRLNNTLWGKILWQALLGSHKQIQRNLTKLEHNPHIGLITAAYCVSNEAKFYHNFLPKINQELQAQGFPPTKSFSFPAGAMFLARSQVLKPLLAYTINNFSPTISNIKEGTFAHLIERMFGAFTEAQGYTIAPTPHKSYIIYRLLITLKRFIYQKKHTKTGKTLIKICKIPIFSKP